MSRYPVIKLQNISFQFSHKTCFDDFSHTVLYGEKIAIIGDNGAGKSTLLKIIRQEIEPSDGSVEYVRDLSIGYVEQTVREYDGLSGAQRFNKALSRALSAQPQILLLDEPTNHLDLDNKKSLIKMLERYRGTLIIVSHETSLLSLVDSVWHIKDGKIHEFSCSYKGYLSNQAAEKALLLKELKSCEKERKHAHDKLMFEQDRAKKRKAYGEKKYQGDTLTLQGKKRQGAVTTANRKRDIGDQRLQIMERVEALYIPEEIHYKFSLDTTDIARNQSVVSVKDGACYYGDKLILKGVNLNILGGTKVALLGKNGSGKSTLMNVLNGHQNISVRGEWKFSATDRVGFLDQHYAVLNTKLSVFETIQLLRSDWDDRLIRDHLNQFLFRKNEEVENKISALSGGERVRLALARIAAKPPQILYLDEPTNNLDITAKNHLVAVLKSYPGAMLIISHDEDFLSKIGIDQAYSIENCLINRQNFAF